MSFGDVVIYQFQYLEKLTNEKMFKKMNFNFKKLI